jgi:hypothetical protein
MSNPAELRPNTAADEELSRLLQLELIQKRAAWKQASQRRRSLRSAAFLFLFLLIAGCLLGFFFVFSRVNEERPNRPATTTNH